MTLSTPLKILFIILGILLILTLMLLIFYFAFRKVWADFIDNLLNSTNSGPKADPVKLNSIEHNY